ncbi:ankyrin repeat domain-containing protein [Streptomyces sp. DT171]|uniref:ankyrin repeat domain-containing protein n=1 Tax=Streptomyces sp. DT171 TaxID=3416524 RepID=UPI003CEF0402
MTKEPIADARNLFEALHDGEDAVLRLLRAGVSPESVDEDGTTVLYQASVEGLTGAVRLLLAAGADPDRASGPEAGDLPLCGAACGGGAEVVDALLAAGARPDLPEQFGFTALRWAVGLGYSRIVEALLSHGADPDLAGPEGDPPLVLAARRGSVRTVRALLRHGAGSRSGALAEARRTLAVDVAEEMRRGLIETYGAHEVVVDRAVVDGGVTVTVELLRGGEPFAGRDQQTGHGAVVTVLEGELGIRVPAAELAVRALRGGGPELDDWHEQVSALWSRGDEETFLAAAAWCAAGDPALRAFGADVLGRLGFRADERPFAARAVPLLRALAREADDREPVRAAVTALGHHGDRSALPEILRHAGHPDRGVRYAVASALSGLAPADRVDGVAALVALSGDTDARVRGRAATALTELGGGGS